MTSGEESRSGGLRAPTGSDRRELVLTVLLGAAGAGLVLLASHQSWAHVRTIPPRPLPASNVNVTGSALVPYFGALALAGLATLAAVLATRGVARRLTGLVLAVIGASLAASAFTVTSATAVAAASSNSGPVNASAGSVTDGNGQATGIPNIAGATPHVTFNAGGWQALVVVGALAMIGAGALVVWRARRMAVMSGRYDSPTAKARSAWPPQRSDATAGSDATVSSDATVGSDTRQHLDLGGAADGTTASADSASMWEALSQGDDPTVTSGKA